MSEIQPSTGYRTVETLTASDRSSFIRIYESSFPRSERDDTQAVLARIESGRRFCMVAHRNHELIGLAVLLALVDLDIQFLEYFAVDSRLRSLGIGSQFLGHLGAELRSAPSPASGIVFEVDQPDLAESEERRLRQRRIEFYKRNGAVLVECAPTYRAPNLEHEGTLPSSLMWLPLDPQIRRLGGDLLKKCVLAILMGSYELRSDDPLVHEVISELIC
jgi:ribosomal protein S18 acetylase RimI-like enzyme